MLHEQRLPARYVDKEKLGRFWETNDDFKGKGCGIVDKIQDSLIIRVPRDMTLAEIASVYYDKHILDSLADEAEDSFF